MLEQCYTVTIEIEAPDQAAADQACHDLYHSNKVASDIDMCGAGVTLSKTGADENIEALTMFIKANGSALHSESYARKVEGLTESEVRTMCERYTQIDACVFIYFVDKASYGVVAIYDKELRSLEIAVEAKFLN